MTTLDHELEMALRAETPLPSAAFAERLDRAVAAGFPRARRFHLPKRPLLPTLAAAAALLVALVVVLSLNGRGGNGSGGAGSGEQSAVRDAKTVAGGARALAAPAPSLSDTASSGVGRAQFAPATPLRHVERSASLTLGAPGSKLDSVAKAILSVADRRLGFVQHYSVTTGKAGDTGGLFDLRVPSAALEATLADLSRLADVRSRTQSADDLTHPYHSTAARLEEARALRRSLLTRLAQATTDIEVQALRKRIRLESAEIRSLSVRFAALRRVTQFAAIEVTLVRERAHRGAAATGVGHDFHDALHSLAVSFGIALRILGVAIPLGLVALLAWLAASVLKRRRREAALL